MTTLSLILLILSVVFAALAMASVPTGRLNTVGAALFCYFLMLLLART